MQVGQIGQVCQIDSETDFAWRLDDRRNSVPDFPRLITIGLVESADTPEVVHASGIRPVCGQLRLNEHSITYQEVWHTESPER